MILRAGRLAFAMLLWALVVSPSVAADRASVERAIVAAVQARMGERLDVRLDRLRIDLPDATADDVVAVLPPEARFGEPTRVVLRASARDRVALRAGSATVTIRSERRTWVATKALSRFAVVATDDATCQPMALDGLRIAALPRDVRDSRLLRDVAAGQVLQASLLRPVPVVRRGDEVVVAVRIGDLRVSTLGVAGADGRIGQAIAVTNKDSGKAIVAHVVGRGAVEVRHGS